MQNGCCIGKKVYYPFPIIFIVCVEHSQLALNVCENCWEGITINTQVQTADTVQKLDLESKARLATKSVIMDHNVN